MGFHFAWVDPGETAFQPSFAREDEEVLSFEIRHDEGDFASLRLEVRNPRVGLLSIGRKRWAWLSHREGTVTIPLFFGRLVGLPQEMSEDVVVLSFIAKPLNYQSAKEALAATMRELQYWDPLFISGERRAEPDTVLEARPMVWHVDRVSHELTASHILAGEAGTIDFGGDAFADSVTCSYTGAPQRKVVIEATVNWTQYGFGTIREAFRKVESYTGDGLLSAWPRTGQRVGGGWTVADGFAKDIYNRINTTTIKDDDGVPKYAIYKWSISGWVDFTYEAERRYSELATFTMSSSLQEIVTEAGDEEVISIAVSGDADEPIDTNGALPIGDLRRRAYFTTERGNRSVAYLANVAAARLLASARCVEISFDVPFSYAASLSLKHSGTISDPRLPGGTATGKIKSYVIYGDGDTGEVGCAVTLGCTPGYGETVTPVGGTPVYTAEDYATSYQVFTGGTRTVVVDGNGDPAMTITNYDSAAINDDGLNLFNMTKAYCVLETTLQNPASVQANYIYSSSADTNTAMADLATRLGVRLRPVNGGPFETPYTITTSLLSVPKTIDLEASSS